MVVWPFGVFDYSPLYLSLKFAQKINYSQLLPNRIRPYRISSKPDWQIWSLEVFYAVWFGAKPDFSQAGHFLVVQADPVWE